MTPNKKMPLFIVSGASGVGKTSACELLFLRENRYIVMESDLLWRDVFDTPEDNYREYRETWMHVCAGISQIGLPVVLCGCGLPEQFEVCAARELFTDIHYIAVVCEQKELERRMREGREITDEAWLESSRHFNEWLKRHAGETVPAMELLDNTCLSVEQTAERIDAWIMGRQKVQQEQILNCHAALL